MPYNHHNQHCCNLNNNVYLLLEIRKMNITFDKRLKKLVVAVVLIYNIFW